MYFDIENAIGIGNVDVKAYTLAFVKRSDRFLQGGIFYFTDFDMQEPFDDALTYKLIFHDRAEHKVIGKGEFFDGFMSIFHSCTLAAPSIVEIARQGSR